MLIKSDDSQCATKRNSRNIYFAAVFKLKKKVQSHGASKINDVEKVKQIRPWRNDQRPCSFLQVKPSETHWDDERLPTDRPGQTFSAVQT